MSDLFVIWQHRPLGTIYPVVCLDGIVLKMCQNNRVIDPMRRQICF